MRSLPPASLLVALVVGSALGQTFTATPSSLSFSFPQGKSLPPLQTLNLSSQPAGSFSVAFQPDSGGNWLDVTPKSGVTPAMLTAQVDPFSGGLAAGVYTGNVIINSSFKIPATLTVTAALTVAPTSVSFMAQQVAGNPTPVPPVQNISVTSSSAAAITASAASTGNWLSVSPATGTTPATLKVSANPAGLAAGSYTGTISVSSPGATTVTVNVSLTVQPPLVLTASPATLNFVSTSAQPTPPAEDLSVFSTAPSPFSIAVSTASGGNWLSVSPATAQTPAALQVSASPGSLAPGTYSGSLKIANGPTVPVTLTVTASQPPTLQVTPETSTFSSVPGGLPNQGGISVTNAGGGTLAYSASVSGGAWLALSASSGTLGAGATATIPITITPGSLAVGTYNATVTVSANGQTASTLVILTINNKGPALQVSQTGLVFTAVAQGANPPAQSVYVVDTGTIAATWSATTSTLSGGMGWLTAAPSSGSSQPFPAAPPTMTVSVNTQTLAAGTYYGSVMVNSQVISVQTIVLPAGQTLPPSLSANGVVLTDVAGTPNGGTQTIAINNPLSYTTLGSTDDGANWLLFTQQAGSLTIASAASSLAAGIRHGTLRLAFSDGSFQTISLVSVVAPVGTSAQIKPAAHAPQPQASGNCPTVLIPQVTSLAPNFSVTVAQSVPVTVRVVDDCGHIPNSASTTVTAGFADATKPGTKLQPSLTLTPQGNGIWSGTWTPQAAAAQAQIAFVGTAINGTNPFGGQSTLKGTIQAAGAGAPALPTGIFNAASYQAGNTVALGSFVSIFGSNLANGTNTPSTQPLPVSVGGTQVLLGGVALPLQFAGSTQINALIPAGVTVDSQQPLIVQRDQTQAAPTTVTIAETQPGIYTTNQQGSGQGAVLTSDNVIAAPVGAFPGSHPAARGDFIQVFCTGLGAVTNPPGPGAVAPISPLSSTLGAITSSVGGINAQVLFSGLAPGFIGLYQVNLVIPQAAPTGNAVTLSLSAGAAVSNVATIAVQ